jgi:hypothetical protein
MTVMTVMMMMTMTMTVMMMTMLATMMTGGARVSVVECRPGGTERTCRPTSI